MLDVSALLDTYRAVKAHDNEIMAKRPAGHPSADWRMRHPHNKRTAFRVIRDGKEFGATLNCDTVPILRIWTTTEHPRIIENIDLKSDTAAATLAAYDLPAPGDMTNSEFSSIRRRFGLTQAQLAPLLELGSAMRVSEYERGTNPRAIPAHIARLMNAMDDGWRPSDWPAGV